MKLGTKLTVYLSLIIVIVLSGYGYFHIMSRRESLIKKMKVEVESTSRNLRVSLEKVQIHRDRKNVQNLIDGLEEYEKTLGIIIYNPEKEIVIRSRSLDGGIDHYLELIKKAINLNIPQEEFGAYKKLPIFIYAIPLKDENENSLGGVAIIQHTSFMEEDIKIAKLEIFITILVLIGLTLAFINFMMRRWITRPISQLMVGIRNLAQGDLNVQISSKRGDELSELAREFNRMAIDLKKAKEKIIQDAETRLELERSLRRSEKLATIGQLASGLAHEIGTPLNIIGGRAELIKRRVTNPEDSHNLDVIIKQADRITKIIKQLLGFGRRKRPEQSPIDINVLLNSVTNFLEYQFKQQGIRFLKEMEDDLPPVLGDMDQLQQVFLNLILNGLQSMPNGGVISISASTKWISKDNLENSKRYYLEVRVADTGVGMDKEVMENIFNPFFTTKEQGEGSGLGLYVSQGILHDHEGWIEVESEVGKGSVFKVYLPTYEKEIRVGGQKL